MVFFLFKQKTAYEMRFSDWRSDVCSSDLSHYLALRQLDRREIMARHAGVAGGFAVADEDRPHMRPLSEYLAMPAKAREAQRFVVGLGVDQHQIGLDVAIAVARPIPAQIRVAVLWITRRVRRGRGRAGEKITKG